MSASLPQWLVEFAQQAEWCARHCEPGRRPVVDGLVAARSKSAGSQAWLPALRVHKLAQWRRGGMPVVELAAPLAAAFCLTDYDAAEAADCRWPFPTFAVSLRGGSPMEISEDGDRTRPCRLVWFHAFSDDGGDKEFVLAEPDDSHLAADTATLHAVSLPLSQIGPVAWIGDGRARDSQLPMADCDRAAICNARRILVGLSLWLRERGLSAPVRSRPRTKAERRATADGELPDVWEVGREVPLVQSLVDAARARGQRGDRAAWQLHKRFVVRGHWRRQPCGPGRAERRLTFVQPFWKGPRDGTGISHLYAAGAAGVEVGRTSTS